jgi:hypothetical protein
MGGEHARALGHGRLVGDEVLGPGPRVEVHLPGDEVNRVYDVAASFLSLANQAELGRRGGPYGKRATKHHDSSVS